MYIKIFLTFLTFLSHTTRFIYLVPFNNPALTAEVMYHEWKLPTLVYF